MFRIASHLPLTFSFFSRSAANLSVIATNWLDETPSAVGFIPIWDNFAFSTSQTASFVISFGVAGLRGWSSSSSWSLVELSSEDVEYSLYVRLPSAGTVASVRVAVGDWEFQ